MLLPEPGAAWRFKGDPVRDGTWERQEGDQLFHCADCSSYSLMRGGRIWPLDFKDDPDGHPVPQVRPTM
jgi:hypothetical protein